MLNLTLYNCDVLNGLGQIPSESVDCIVTSPPYWGLRNYGKETEVIWDSPFPCEHDFSITNHKGRGGGDPVESTQVGNNKIILHFSYDSNFCSKCGAWKGQLGLEPDFHLYLNHLLQITAELQRVLKPTGTVWWNHGDTYGGSQAGNGDEGLFENSRHRRAAEFLYNEKKPQAKIMQKCKLMLPERLALRMVDEQGWILRNTIIWNKPNHMPSSVKDRLSNGYEVIYFFVKNKNYYFNLDAIRTPITDIKRIDSQNHLEVRKFRAGSGVTISADAQKAYYEKIQNIRKTNPDFVPLKNPGDVWSITTHPYREAHFATFPKSLPKRCIRAGCPENGTVLDPFTGSGTTLSVALENNLNAIGIEINPRYVKLIKKRCSIPNLKTDFQLIASSSLASTPAYPLAIDKSHLPCPKGQTLPTGAEGKA